MWATHRGLSKPCANRASCPSPSGSGGSRWSHRFLSEQIGEQDDSFAVRTAASESHRASVQMAVRAAPLAKEALATTRTFVDGVRHEQSLALELLAEDDQNRRWPAVGDAADRPVVYSLAHADCSATAWPRPSSAH